MRWTPIVPLAAAAVLLIGCAVFDPVPVQASCGTRTIALSFDDAPSPDTANMKGLERTRSLLHGMKQAGVRQAGFFSVARAATGEGRERLAMYARAGHVIANHSATHPDLHRVGAGAFIADVAAADDMLRRLPGFVPLFRYPYLHEGRTTEERDTVRRWLRASGYREGYVTVDTYDFYIDRFLQQAAAQGRNVDLRALSAVYVDSVAGAADFYDRVACSYLGRSPAHVLLLHENDVAALFLPLLVRELRQRGWRIIAISQAYEDPIARSSPGTLFLGQGRIAAIAHSAGAPSRSLHHESEDEAYLDVRLSATLAQR